jgi:hypothetical protein
MGYGPNSTSIYNVMDVETKRVFHTPTVKFDEEIFPGLPSVASNLPYRNETRVDRVPKQLAGGSALPPFESGIDSGNKEPQGREKRKNAPIHNDYSSKLRERTMTQGESQGIWLEAEYKTKEKVLIRNCLQAYHKAMGWL